MLLLGLLTVLCCACLAGQASCHVREIFEASIGVAVCTGPVAEGCCTY